MHRINRTIDTVIATVRYDGEHKHRLKEIFAPAEVRFVDPFDAAGIQRALQSADAAILSGDLDTRFLSAPRLKWVHCDHSGIERSAAPQPEENGVIVTGSAGRSSPALAEHAMLFMLALSYDFPAFLDAQRARRWGFPGMNRLRGLYGKTAGIIGMGHTGKELALRAAAFGMHVIGYRRKALDAPRGVDSVYSAESGDRLDRVLRSADFVVLAVSLNNETRHLISSRELEMMKPTAYLINISRGLVVDESALVNALLKRRIAGAGLDVFETEPLPTDSPLWHAPNTLITPHVTPQVPDRTGRSLDIIEENLRRFLAGDELVNQLQPEDTFTAPVPEPRKHWLLSAPWLPGGIRDLAWKIRDRIR